jgi:hypothetical protein
MTRPVSSPLPELPESTVNALHALYREGATAEPSLALDRSILEAARAEVQVSGATQTRRPAPWWKSWLPVTSVIAVAVVGVSVTWRVMDEQERHLREEMRAQQAEGERAGRVVPAQRPAETHPAFNAPVPVAEKSRRAESAVVRDAPIAVSQPEAKPAPAVLAAPAAPTAIAPMVAEEVMKKSQRAETDQLRDRRDASASKEAASSPTRQMGKLEAGGFAAGSSGEKGADLLARPSTGSAVNSVAQSVAKSVAAPAADAATPEAWLQHIRELRTGGRSAEAAQSLTRFRARYPDFLLPDDLHGLK